MPQHRKIILSMYLALDGYNEFPPPRFKGEVI
jgi:hypothetical protein